MTKKVPIYKIVFDDNTVYEGGNYKESKWLDIPEDRYIKSLFYRLPTADYLSLNNYDKYYHFVEGTRDFHAVNGLNNTVKVRFLNVLGKKGNMVYWYKIDVSKNVGSIELKVKKINDNEIKKLNSNGWKKGRRKNEKLSKS